MLEVELKSKDLMELIYLQLEKNRQEPIYDTDLDKITELDLDKCDLINEQTDITLEDIVFFNKLKTCYIANFVLDDYNIKLLSTRTNLDFLQINDCVFNHNEELDLDANYIAIVDCENVDLSKFAENDKLEKLRIVNCVNVKIDGISKFENLSKVYLQNINIDNINEMKKMENLKYVNLNGSFVNNNLFERTNTDVKIEHEEINMMYDSED